MKTFATLVDAINDLKSRGYKTDFNLRNNMIQCSETGIGLSPDEFEITEYYHFDGKTNVDDEVIVYAIESKDGLKGTLVNAYGPYADSMSDQLIAKLAIHK